MMLSSNFGWFEACFVCIYVLGRTRRDGFSGPKRRYRQMEGSSRKCIYAYKLS